jgi:hypothetical protein
MLNVIEIADIKGIELSTSEMASLAAMVANAEQNLNAACYAAHKAGIDNMILIAESVIALRAIVDANLGNLGNFTSFKAWVGDRKFGIREIGYKQMSLYATIGKHPDIARRLYNEEQVYALSELAKRINEETGNVKSGGRKVSDSTESDAAESAEIEDAEVLEVTNVTSLAAVLAFIEVADAEQIAAIKAALKAKK